MAALGFSDLLSLVQSIVLICALGVTLYFSRIQAKVQRQNLETAILANIDEKQHHLTEMLMGDPTLMKLIVNEPTLRYTKDETTAWYTISICAYAFRMKEREILSGPEWDGLFLWMKNMFQSGSLRKYWKDVGYETWFEPSFRDFVNNELLAASR